MLWEKVRISLKLLVIHGKGKVDNLNPALNDNQNSQEDFLDDDNDNEIPSMWVFMPDSTFKNVWDTFLNICYTISFFLIPMQLAFEGRMMGRL